MRALVALVLLACSASGAGRPNLLVIQTDEHNFRTLGCYRALLAEEQALMWGPSVVETPHIDALAAGGVLCTSFYATTPVCSPSRASFVSGRYPHAVGVIDNDQPLSGSVVTFAELLRRAGYATGYLGKWHLDGGAKPGWAPRRKFGFDENRYMWNRGHWKQLEDSPEGPRVKARDAKGEETYSVEGAHERSFTTDFLTTKAIDFLRRHKGEPFCLYLSFPDPHGPDTVRAPYDTLYADVEFERPRTFDQELQELPSWARPMPSEASQAGYWGMVKCIDDNVGRLIAALAELGLARDTIVVFTADHGDLRGEHTRDNKSAPFEASACVPFVLRWPARVPAGRVVREALGTVDFLPTVLALMSVETAGKEQGRDASKLFLTGRRPPHWTGPTILRSTGKGNEGWIAAVSDRWKLVYSVDDPPWLFDLERDPDELVNHYADPAANDVIRSFSRALADYGERFADPRLRDPRIETWVADGSKR